MKNVAEITNSPASNQCSSGAQLPSFDAFPAVVQETLSRYIAQRRAEVDGIGTPVSQLAQHLENFVLAGGKRIRPLFTWAGFIGAGGVEKGVVDPAAVITLASSLEFIQACALIHDDIIDASDTRRGFPTIHRAVEREHQQNNWQGSASRYGEAAAILVGDLALTWSDDMFHSVALPADVRAAALVPWRAMRTEVIGGQLLDIHLEATGSESLELASTVNHFKTAAYTIERPLHLGAVLGGASPEIIAAFRGYGRDIGMAYQLRDDELGVFGDPQVTGKPAGDDLREGKRTVLLNLALQEAGADDAQTLRSLVGNTAEPADIARMSQIIAASGAREQLEEKIASLTASGLAHLRSMQADSTVTDMLEQLAIKATARQK